MRIRIQGVKNVKNGLQSLQRIFQLFLFDFGYFYIFRKYIWNLKKSVIEIFSTFCSIFSAIFCILPSESESRRIQCGFRFHITETNLNSWRIGSLNIILAEKAAAVGHYCSGPRIQWSANVLPQLFHFSSVSVVSIFCHHCVSYSISAVPSGQWQHGVPSLWYH